MQCGLHEKCDKVVTFLSCSDHEYENSYGVFTAKTNAYQEGTQENEGYKVGNGKIEAAGVFILFCFRV